MIMPFLRLVVIYIVVICAAVLFFKRDTVMPLLGLSGGAVETAAVSTPKTPPPTASTKPAETLQTPVADEPAAAQTTAPPKYATEQTAQIVTSQPAATPKASADDIQNRLNEARQAYWKRDMAAAEAHYKGLVNDMPENADILGELGNLYYAQRRMDEAAKMYHQAGVLLIKDGKPQQVMGLIGVLQSIAPNKASDLRNHLSQ